MMAKLKALALIALAFVQPSHAETLAEKLNNAVVLGRLAEIDNILNANPELKSYSDADGNSLMHLAITFYNDGVVDLLLKHKVSFRTPNAEKESPLQRAAFFGLNKVALSLLNAGADWMTLSKDMQSELAKYSDFKKWTVARTNEASKPKSGKTVLELPGARLQVISFSSNLHQ